MNYHKLAFTDAVKEMQEAQGSRGSYSHMENRSSVDGLTEDEISFISERDSFYMASYGANSFPYIQHRGGPSGFIKIIDNKTIGIVDFAGNKQYISVGNISQNNKVALILVSYPQRARLKIYAEIEIVELSEDSKLYESIKPLDYKFKPERMMLFHVKAFDWNCPQHITARYTAEEIEKALAPQKKHVAALERQIEELKRKLATK